MHDPTGDARGLLSIGFCTVQRRHELGTFGEFETVSSHSLAASHHLQIPIRLDKEQSSGSWLSLSDCESFGNDAYDMFIVKSFTIVPIRGY